jgi:peptidoglycan hydrolase CwlO-like protein
MMDLQRYVQEIQTEIARNEAEINDLKPVLNSSYDRVAKLQKNREALNGLLDKVRNTRLEQ